MAPLTVVSGTFWGVHGDQVRRHKPGSGTESVGASSLPTLGYSGALDAGSKPSLGDYVGWQTGQPAPRP